MNLVQFLQTALDWLSSPVGKTLALYASGWAFKAWPAFFNKAIPVGTASVNVLLTILNLLAQSAAGAGSIAAVAAVQAQPVNIVLDVLLPQLIADGAYNWPRSVWHWIRDHSFRVRAPK